MSGWIKLEKDLANDPRVLKMASRMSHENVTVVTRDRLLVIGALVTLWWYADTHIRDRNVLPIGPDQIDELVGIKGFCNLIPSDWLKVIDSDHVELVDYVNHNGTSAKQRAEWQTRKARQRSQGKLSGKKSHANVPRKSRSRPGTSVTREDSSSPSSINLFKKEEEEKDPDGLDRAAYDRWVAYRKQAKKPLNPMSLDAIKQTMVREFGSGQAQAVDHTIAMGWQGLRAPEPQRMNGSKPAQLAVTFVPSESMFGGKR